LLPSSPSRPQMGMRVGEGGLSLRAENSEDWALYVHSGFFRNLDGPELITSQEPRAPRALRGLYLSRSSAGTHAIFYMSRGWRHISVQAVIDAWIFRPDRRIEAGSEGPCHCARWSGPVMCGKSLAMLSRHLALLGIPRVVVPHRRIEVYPALVISN